jgi:cytochrome b
MKVWDGFVRVAHWTLASSVIVAWATHEGGGRWHEWIGYVALATAILRILWGFAGSRYARFAQFVYAPKTTLAYAGSVLKGHELRYIGHNPLGGWMVVVLLLTVTASGFTGWLFTTDRFWGDEWLEELHGAISNALLPLVALHLAGVIFTSWKHRENLVRAMFTGRKRDPSATDVS